MSIKTGDKITDFKLYDTERKERSLSEFLGQKTVLVFYPGAFTGVCTNEMCHMRDSMSVFNSANAKVVGISVDSPFANKAFAEANQIKYPLLSDIDKSVSKRISGLYDAFAHIPGYAASKRSVFILDADAVVKYMWSTDDPGIEPPYDEIKKALTAF